jgi:hypothetical protein
MQDVDFFQSELSSLKGYVYLGSDLLDFALAEIEEPTSQLYTFQSNADAQFYPLERTRLLERRHINSRKWLELSEFIPGYPNRHLCLGIQLRG